MTLRKAIDTIEMSKACKKEDSMYKCSYQDNDTCAGCSLYVSGSDLEEAREVVFNFVKAVYAIHNELKEY